MRLPTRLKQIGRVSRMGGAIFPVVEAGKKPAVARGFKAALNDAQRVERFFRANPKLNYGIATGAPSRFFAVDVDGPKGRASLAALVAKHGPLPKTVQVKTPHGQHYYFKTPSYPIPSSVGRVGTGIDVRGEGGYVVGPGSATPDGTYRFANGLSPAEVAIAAAPAWLLALSGKKLVPAEQIALTPQGISPDMRDRATAYAKAAFDRERSRLRNAPVHQRNNTLNLCAFKLGGFVARGLISKSAVTYDLARIAKEIGLEEQEIGPTIASGLGAGIKSPVHLPFDSLPSRGCSVAPPTIAADELTEALSRLGENDIANADRFVKRFGDRVIYTERQGFMVFDSKRYRPNSQLQCVELGKVVVSKIEDEIAFLSGSAAIARGRFAALSKSKGAIDRMLDLSKGRLLVKDASLDADPLLLNTVNCTIDLRTGRHHPHDARDLLTKISPVTAKVGSKCPLFDVFLKRITGGDKELAIYIQKAVGLSLTGIITEQVLFFVYGKSGSNGKSTLVNLIRKMLGDYATHTPTETLLTKNYDNAIPADLARLEGSRMVTAIESNVNRQLDEAKIKAMTGGEPIAARLLYKNFSEFTPQFKLWFVANDRPHVRATDDAIWRRIRVIPLNVKIPPDQVDRDLSQKLEAELPGILSWAIRGTLKWQKEGLAEPEMVVAASAGWRKSVDHVRRFVTETLVIGCAHDEVVPAGELHSRFKTWCLKHGESPMSAGRLKARLEEAFDLTHAQTKRGSEWRGVRWKS